MSLPKEIHVSRHMWYNVADIVQNIVDMDMERDHDSVTLEEVVTIALDYAYDDFSTLMDFEPIVEDEEGNVLN